MGKKSFVSEDYDPIGNALAVDEAKVGGRSAQQPAAPLPIQAEPIAETAAPRPAPPRAVPVSVPKRRPAVNQPTRPVPRTSAETASNHHAQGDEVSKRIKVSRNSFLEFEASLTRIHQETRTQIPYSVATRLSWDLWTIAEAHILAEMKRHPVGSLPTTKDPIAYASYQERLLKIVAAAYRKLPRTLFQGPVDRGGEDD